MFIIIKSKLINSVKIQNEKKNHNINYLHVNEGSTNSKIFTGY